MQQLERQLALEAKSSEFSFHKFMNDITKRIQGNATHELPEGTILVKTCIDHVANKITEYFKAPIRGNNKKARSYIEEYAYRPHDLAYLIISVLIDSLSRCGTLSAVAISKDISLAIYQDYAIRNLKGSCPNLDSYMDKKFRRRGYNFIRRSKIKLGINKVKLNNNHATADMAILGATLLDIVDKSSCNLIHIYSLRVNKKTTTTVTFTKEAFNLILQAREYHMQRYVKYPILIMPPSEWKGLRGNMGYYSKKGFKGMAIKMKQGNTKIVASYLEQKPMTRCLNILNNIAKTSWRINKKVFDTIEYIMKENLVDYDSHKLSPYLLGKLPYNRQMVAEDFIKGSDFGLCYADGWKANTPIDKEEYKRYRRALDSQEERIVVNNSKSIALNLAMIDAKDYYQEPNIYFSYQFDFRGRIYPVQQHLNPQGKDEVKALLEFSKGYPINTDEELYWFKIHGANCYGYDKLEYEERVSEISKKEEEIHLIASDPIRYNGLWKDADSPYLYLAWCFEYSAYLSSPSTFRSHIPIALDGTCSGIQIYSGLLLDGDGAKEVNVVGNKRKDIYQVVADKGNEYLLKGEYNKFLDITTADGNKKTVSTVATASSLSGKINRSLTKRNVMTQPYSVTKYGMYNQLVDILTEKEDNGDVFWVGDKWLAAKILVDINERAIIEVVKGARIGQEFLKSITRDITRQGNYVFYTTPIMKFPVLQKITKYKENRINTELGRLLIKTHTDEIHQIKMVNGIAPNYIHSLDATLLFLTVEKMFGVCEDFHLIHDSYGVPVTHIPLLNKCIRDSYIELFSSNPLHRFVRQTCNERIAEVDEVMLNTLDINDVADARYIFS